MSGSEGKSRSGGDTPREPAPKPVGWLTRIAARCARRPMSVLATAFTLSLLVAALSPFDFVANTEQLHASLVDARWMPNPESVSAWFSAGSAGITRTDLLSPMAAGRTVLFAALGFLLALSAREQGHEHRAAFDSALGHAALLAVLIETMQFFVVSRSFDFANLVSAAFGAALGALLAVYAVATPANTEPRP